MFGAFIEEMKSYDSVLSALNIVSQLLGAQYWNNHLYPCRHFIILRDFSDTINSIPSGCIFSYGSRSDFVVNNQLMSCNFLCSLVWILPNNRSIELWLRIISCEYGNILKDIHFIIWCRVLSYPKYILYLN